RFLCVRAPLKPVQLSNLFHGFQELTTMLKQTRRNFLAMTAVSAAGLPLTKGFSSATVTAPEEKPPTGTVTVHVTTGEQRYSQSGSLAWQSASRTRIEDTIVLRGVHSKQPILGFGAALTDAACYVIHQLPEAERERLLQELFHPDQMALSVCRLCIG